MPCRFRDQAKCIQRYLEIGHAIRLCRWQITGADIDLYRRKYQYRHFQRRISTGTHVHKLGFADAIMDMNIFSALLTHGRFKRHSAIRRWVIVAHEVIGMRMRLEYSSDAEIFSRTKAMTLSAESVRVRPDFGS